MRQARASGDSRRRWRTLSGSLLAGLLVLTGCTDAPVAEESVTYQPCASKCAGKLSGAEYRILMPKRWNGTLLLYSHGYRASTSIPVAEVSANADGGQPRTAAEPAPGDITGESGLAAALLAKGYALAGSGYASNGWAVADGLAADVALIRFFSETVGEPQRVYAWGDSLGGLITTLLAQMHPDLITAAAPMCGAVAGIIPNMDLALDLAVGYRTLLDPGFPLAFASAETAAQGFARAATNVRAAVKAGGEQAAAILALAGLVDAATRTAAFDARDATSRLAGAAESVVVGLAFATAARYEAEQRFGGQISSNRPATYPGRLSRLDRLWIDHFGGAGTARRFATKLAAAPEVVADAAAVRRAVARGGAPTGQLGVPTITLHTTADPLVIVQNESVLADRVAAAGDQADLLQLYTSPPRRFTGSAPYGAGHCNFPQATRLALVDLLDGWARSGAKPDAAAIMAALPDSGYDPQFVPAKWPDPLGVSPG